MYTALLTMMFVVGAGRPAVSSAEEPVMAPAPCSADLPRDPQPQTCCVKDAVGYFCDWFKSMPQTCYSPTYGCYPGNGRDIQRYPAFHGTYYRRAYNYRQLQEWPWLAEPHEPIGFCTPVCVGPVAVSAGVSATSLIPEPTSAEPIPMPPSATPAPSRK
ncbi:MAG: hypothetical protein ABR915_12800 [Thermoguttaceae bacterium]|jgi:hypothetical protein